MNPQQPIGVLDSGFGGLSVWRSLVEAMPSESFLYAADSRCIPWGDKTDDEIGRRVDVLVSHLMGMNIKALVLACNTATMVTMKRLAAELPVPVFGMTPAVARTLEASATKNIGVMGTMKTVTSGTYQDVKAAVLAANPGARIHDCGCPGLMECVEAGRFDTPETRELVRTKAAPLVRLGVDAVAIACTHYPFLMDALMSAFPAGTVFIDPAPEVAAHCRAVLDEKGMLAPEGRHPRHRFFSTKTGDDLDGILRILTGLEDARFEPIEG